MADNFTVLNSAAATVTFRSTDVGAGIQGMMSIPMNPQGTALLGQSTAATSIPVVLPSNQIVSTNLTSLNGTTVNTGSGAIAAGTQRVALATDSPGVVAFGQAVMATSLPVAIASNQSAIPVVGNIASGVSDSGNPIGLGAVGHTASPTAVGDGQRVTLIADKVGKLLAVGAIRDLKATQTATLSTAAETVIVNALNATTFADMYGLILANTGATTTKVDIRYGTGSAIVMSFEVPTTDTRGFMVPVDSAIPGSIATANASWTAQAAATAAINVSVFYVKNI